MRVGIAAVLVIGMLANVAKASPLVDFIIGTSLVVTGGVFEFQRADAASKKEEDTKKAIDLIGKSIDADESFWYFYGSASWEFFNNGNTAAYRSLLSTANTYLSLRNSYASQSTPFSNSAGDNRDKEKLYKGVSLTSFAVGGAFIFKAAVTYWAKRTYSKEADNQKLRWAKNIELQPTASMDGARLGYQIAF